MTGKTSISTKLGTLRNRTERTRPAWTLATAIRRPDGASTTTSVDGPLSATIAASIAQVTSAMVPWPQAVL